ncbi:MAG TPA: nucleotide exchange factor GrpE [Solirubrobacterales bacterium]|nr:nucleotide exchange factor GrpE [Solirubrobacterales bacterium]
MPEEAKEAAAEGKAPADEVSEERAQEAQAAQTVEEDFDALLDQTKRERDEYLDLAQRTRADFENYRKRMAAETQAAAARGRAELAGELIAVVDSLERALAAAEVDPGDALNGEASSDRPLEEGILLTYRELTAALRRAGVEAYDPAGEAFDPAWHEALGTQPAGDESKPGQVIEVLQKGYRLDGQVLRAARVMVSE